MNKTVFLGAILLAISLCAHAQPQQQPIVSKTDMTTVEFVVRDGKPLLMDIYQFKDQKTEGKRPVFVYSFGGGWAMGSRVDALCNPLYDHLCEKGGVCVAIDYRLGSARGRDGKQLITPPEGYNPFQYSIDIGVEDIYAATNWLIKHADEYNIDPGKIVLYGSIFEDPYYLSRLFSELREGLDLRHDVVMEKSRYNLQLEDRAAGLLAVEQYFSNGGIPT